MVTLTEKLNDLLNERKAFVLVTLVGVKGSAPQVLGAKMLVTEQGLYFGTVGGGKIEAHCIIYAQLLLKNRKSSETRTWNLQTDIGMSCGGEVSVFFDPHIHDSWEVNIFGAGHVSQELCRIMQTWNCLVNVYDTRPEWIEKLPASHNIKKHLVDNLENQVSGLSKGSFLLSLTQGHASDLPVLLEAFRRFEDFSYLGVIGSDVKAKKLKAELASAGVDIGKLEKLHCPIGLPIGNNTPPEIAVSIAAQLLQRRGS